MALNGGVSLGVFQARKKGLSLCFSVLMRVFTKGRCRFYIGVLALNWPPVSERVRPHWKKPRQKSHPHVRAAAPSASPPHPLAKCADGGQCRHPDRRRGVRRRLRGKLGDRQPVGAGRLRRALLGWVLRALRDLRHGAVHSRRTARRAVYGCELTLSTSLQANARSADAHLRRRFTR